MAINSYAVCLFIVRPQFVVASTASLLLDFPVPTRHSSCVFAITLLLWLALLAILKFLAAAGLCANVYLRRRLTHARGRPVPGSRSVNRTQPSYSAEGWFTLCSAVLASIVLYHIPTDCEKYARLLREMKLQLIMRNRWTNWEILVLSPISERCWREIAQR